MRNQYPRRESDSGCDAPVAPPPESIPNGDDDMTTDLDVEMALLALSAQDVGEPTEVLDLSSLSASEKRILLQVLRNRLFNGINPTIEPEAGLPVL